MFGKVSPAESRHLLVTAVVDKVPGSFGGGIAPATAIGVCDANTQAELAYVLALTAAELGEKALVGSRKYAVLPDVVAGVTNETVAMGVDIQVASPVLVVLPLDESFNLRKSHIGMGLIQRLSSSSRFFVHPLVLEDAAMSGNVLEGDLGKRWVVAATRESEESPPNSRLKGVVDKERTSSEAADSRLTVGADNQTRTNRDVHGR